MTAGTIKISQQMLEAILIGTARTASFSHGDEAAIQRAALWGLQQIYEEDATQRNRRTTKVS